jgi:predicted nuclease of predicted toxin-antitoxin system
MRFLADENFPRAAVEALKAAGHDIVWVRLTTPGASDADVLAAATAESRVLLTFDKDFGELAARSVLSAACGVVLLRVPAPSSDAACASIAAQITARDDWPDHFSVIEPGRVRMRRLR